MAADVSMSRKDGPSGPSAYPRRKPRPRITSFDYRGPYAYHVVLLTQARAPHFRGRSLVGYCTELLRVTAERLGFRLLAFCFMPDHLHLLVIGRHDEADLVRLVQRLKQVTAFRFKRDTGLRLWQQSFYDRVLRAEEGLGDVAAYIQSNPVRSGLVASPEDFPLSGGEYLEADGAEAPSLQAGPAKEDPFERARANRDRIWARTGNIDVLELLDAVRGPRQ